LSTSAALPEEKTSSSSQDVEMALQEQPLKYMKGGNEKRMYEKGIHHEDDYTFILINGGTIE